MLTTYILELSEDQLIRLLSILRLLDIKGRLNKDEQRIMSKVERLAEGK